MTVAVCSCGSGLPVRWRATEPGITSWHCDDCRPDGAVRDQPRISVRPPGRGLPGIPGQRGRRTRRDREADR